MPAQCLVIIGQALFLCRIDISGAETVGTMFLRHATQLVPGGLQTIGQRTVAFATLHNMGMSPTTVGQSELIQ